MKKSYRKKSVRRHLIEGLRASRVTYFSFLRFGAQNSLLLSPTIFLSSTWHPQQTFDDRPNPTQSHHADIRRPQIHRIRSSPPHVHTHEQEGSDKPCKAD